jgi:hypothetical protein
MQKRKIFNAFIMLTAGMLFFVSCTSDLIKPEPITPPSSNLSYSGNVQPIFTSKCINCHGGAIAPDLTAANSYNSLNSMGLINTSDPSKSEIYIEMSTGGMSSYCTASEAATVLAWIEQGAKNN